MLLVYLLVSLTLSNSADALCSFPCPHQENGCYTGLIGPRTGVVSTFSCKHPSEVRRSNGEVVECVESAGPFILQRLQGTNEYRCVKRVRVDAAARYSVCYSTHYRQYKQQPTLCEGCTASPDQWLLNFSVVKGVTEAEARSVKIPPLGCTVPKNCPMTNPFTQTPCVGCERTNGDGYCCKGCNAPPVRYQH